MPQEEEKQIGLKDKSYQYLIIAIVIAMIISLLVMVWSSTQKPDIKFKMIDVEVEENNYNFSFKFNQISNYTFTIEVINKEGTYRLFRNEEAKLNHTYYIDGNRLNEFNIDDFKQIYIEIVDEDHGIAERILWKGDER